MLTPLLDRKRQAAKTIANAKADVGGALEQTKRIYGMRLLLRGLLWIAIYLIAQGLLSREFQSPPVRVLIAILPTPFFVWYLWTWMTGVAQMDELERRIELEALGFAFPATLVWLMTIGLLNLAMPIDTVFAGNHVWLMMPALYYVGLWRAKRRYA